MNRMTPSRRKAGVAFIAAVSVVLVGLTAASEISNRIVRERSDRFWGIQHVEGLRERYPSLAALVRAVDAVVIGRIESIAPGAEVRDLEAEEAGLDRAVASVYFVRLSVTVETVIAGDTTRPGGTVIVEELGDWTAIPTLEATKPTERTLFFLLDKVVYDASLKGIYEPTRTVRDLNGKAAPVDPDEVFLQEAAGDSFDGFAESLRSIATP